MSDEELTHRLRRRVARREQAAKADNTGNTGNKEGGEGQGLLSSSEQSLGRVLERVDRLEGKLNLIYKVVWRTSAALLGLVAANFGWDWVMKLLRSF